LQQHFLDHPSQLDADGKPLPVAVVEFCEACGNEIPAARRLALPGVTLCIECKNAEELEQKRWAI